MKTNIPSDSLGGDEGVLQTADNRKKQIRLLVEHAMLTSPGSTIVYDCKKCGWRNAFNVENVDSVEAVIRVIEEMMETSDFFREAVWQKIGEYTRQKRAEEEI